MTDVSILGERQYFISDCFNFIFTVIWGFQVQGNIAYIFEIAIVIYQPFRRKMIGIQYICIMKKNIIRSTPSTGQSFGT